MEPLCTSVAPSCLPDPRGLVAAADDAANSFWTAPSNAGQTASIQAAQKQDGPFTPSCSY